MAAPANGPAVDSRTTLSVPLAALTAAAETVVGVRRSDLSPGDRVIVSTRNSIYSLTAEATGGFVVAGGWFDRNGMTPTRVGVNGCTAGGHALFSNLIAAPGFFLEFANGARTTRIRRVRLIGGDGDSPARD